MLAAEMSEPNRETVYTWLTELTRIVLCGRVPVILFYGLPYVKMVIILYTIRDRCSAFDDEFLDCLYHVLGLVSFWRF